MIGVLEDPTQPFRKNSRRVAAAAAVVIALSAPAYAADLRLPVKEAPPPIPVFSWTGLYIGANAGWGSSRNCWDLVPPTPVPPALLGPEGCHDATGAVAGGQIGYRWQTGTWVLGLEAQGNWADLNGSKVSPPFPTTTNRSRIEAFGLFTGQAGWAVQNALLYVKGGAAVADSRFRYTDNATGTVLGAANDTRWGATAGVGLEYGFAPNWSVAVEYDHLFMPNRTHDFVSPAGLYAGTVAIRQDVDLVTARVNYRFGGPVVAKY
ncbi:outer membrane immunogenic protein [Bradyrhizobium sp. AZCC 2262]|uniref:outer membrane protein n=1 Tax=Bradyrhizobium sp. AZCC 2262 TaxID=3117022 RepID=UPI002FEF6E84